MDNTCTIVFISGLNPSKRGSDSTISMESKGGLYSVEVSVLNGLGGGNLLGRVEGYVSFKEEFDGCKISPAIARWCIEQLKSLYW